MNSCSQGRNYNFHRKERKKFVTSSVRFANCKNTSLTLSIESWLISLFFVFRSRHFAAELSWRSHRTQPSIYRWKNGRYLISQFADCVKMRSINISRREKVCFFRSLDANTTARSPSPWPGPMSKSNHKRWIMIIRFSAYTQLLCSESKFDIFEDLSKDRFPTSDSNVGDQNQNSNEKTNENPKSRAKRWHYFTQNRAQQMDELIHQPIWLNHCQVQWRVFVLFILRFFFLLCDEEKKSTPHRSVFRVAQTTRRESYNIWIHCSG